MVAYSGLVNDDVRKQAEEAGFDIVLETPLTVDMIKYHILSLLKEKTHRVQSIKIAVKMSDEIKKSLLKISENSLKNPSNSNKSNERRENDEFSKSNAFDMPSISNSSDRGLIDRLNELNKYVI